MSPQFEVIYEDAWLLVVDKPHGQHTQGTAKGDAGSVIAEAQSQFGRDVRLVHRLDRDASGLLVLARKKAAATVLAKAFREHRVSRTYRALVSIPLPVGSVGTIDKALKWAGGRCWVDASGAKAVTHYSSVALLGSHTELECTLETGRMHQIRVHLAKTLSPIVGDRKYGGVPANQLMLRAVRLSFCHPDSGDTLTFDVPGLEINPDFL